MDYLEVENLLIYVRNLVLVSSHQDIKNLLASWAKAEAENGSCPSEIANKYPAVVVMDDDDLKTDTSTSASEKNHRTNVMFVQNEDLIEHNVPDATAPTLINPEWLKDLVKELNKVNTYMTTSNSNPAIHEQFSIVYGYYRYSS